MSGICGICEPGAPQSRTTIAPMFSALSFPGDARPQVVSGSSVSMGVIPRWPGQEVAEIPGVRISLDSDLLRTERWNPRLEQEGLHPRTLTLAQRVGWLYRLRGLAFLQDLEGSFALSIWDETAQQLLLAIDRMGTRNLCWALESNCLLFSTRPSAIRTVQQEPGEANHDALMQYLLFSVVPAPLTAYAGISKLRPGYLLKFTRGIVEQECYWDIKYTEDHSSNRVEWLQLVREGVRAAVHRQLEGCDSETTGAYLSGGTDSSSVVAFMSERLAPVHTFTVHFSEHQYSEIAYARATAERFGTLHHEKCLEPGDAVSALEEILNYYDEPFANSSAFGGFACARMARDMGVNTLLAGDGGDEIFAGNERYASDRYFSNYHLLPAWLRHGFIEPLVNMLPDNKSWLGLPKRYLRRANISNPKRIFSYGLYFSIPPEQAFTPAFFEKAHPDRWMDIPEAHFHAAKGASELNKLMYLDLKLILADNDLRKVSGTAELSGVRVRYPMLDQQLVELSARIPSTLKLRGFQKRYIYKKAMTGILSAQVLSKKKHGFGVPLSHWFLQEPRLKALLQDVLHDGSTRTRGYFNPAFLDRLARLHRSAHTGYYGEAIWYIVALELWHRRHLETVRERI